MSITEPERHELYETAKHGVGERFAELLMISLPPQPDRLATKDDLETLGAGLRSGMAELKTDMAELRTELKTDMAELRTELKTDMAELRTELKTDMADLRTEMAAMEARLGDKIFTQVTAGTRTVVLALVGSVTAFAITNTVTLLITR